MSDRQLAQGNGWMSLVSLTLSTALSAVAQTAVIGLAGMKAVMLEAILTVAGGGTTVDVWIQTSFDNGTTWVDIANFHFTNVTASKLATVVWDPATPFTAGTAPGDGTLAANTVLNGILGDRLRAKVTTTGTFTGATTLAVNAVIKG